MKFLNIKKIVLPLLVGSIFLASCDKVQQVEPLADKGQKLIHFLSVGGLGSNFNNAANLSFQGLPVEKIQLQLEYLTDRVSANDILVTVAFDAAALAAYNATVPVNKQYFKFPDSTYSFPSIVVKIPAGQTMSEIFYVTFYATKIDPSINYMLPLKIVSITGAPADVKAASGTGIAYLHVIGNPLAGKYNNVGLRRNYNSGPVAWAGPPAPFPPPTSTTVLAAVKTATAVDGQTIELDFSNLGRGTGFEFTYLITANASFSAITIAYSAAFTSGNANIRTYLVSYTPPAPSVKPAFHIITHYNNDPSGSGNDRIIDEDFTHQ